ncbi:MAG: DUF58 domain-containing protein [Flavobacteriales bacterium]|nr:DUF58 domain-containing protein [Flavobacteriales bacterium]
MEILQKDSHRNFSSLELFSREVVEGFLTGLHKSPYHGFSVEFAEHRQYNRGESTRHIDWKLYARTEKLFVKKYEEETNLRCQLVLDTSSSMLFPFDLKPGEHNKLNFSIHAAASLIHLFRKQRDAIGLSTFSDKVNLHYPARGSQTHIRMVFNELEALLELGAKNRNTSVVDALHEIAESIPKRSLVILFTDMFDNADNDQENLFAALQHLRHNKHEVILFNVLDKKKELDFDFENRPHTFIDSETGEQVKLNPSAIRSQYQKQIADFEHQLQVKCGQSRIDFINADIAEGFDKVLLSYLIKRNKMM